MSCAFVVHGFIWMPTDACGCRRMQMRNVSLALQRLQRIPDPTEPESWPVAPVANFAAGILSIQETVSRFLLMCKYICCSVMFMHCI